MEAEEQTYQTQRVSSQPTVSFKLSSPEEKAEIEAMAQEHGMNVSEFIRDRIKKPMDGVNMQVTRPESDFPAALNRRRDFNLLYNKLRDFSSLKKVLEAEIDSRLLSKITPGMSYEAEPLIQNLDYIRDMLSSIEEKAEAICAHFLHEISEERSESWYVDLLADTIEINNIEN